MDIAVPIAAVPEVKVVTNSSSVYLTAILFGFILGLLIAFIYIAYKESSITPQVIACNANNLLYTEIQKIPDFNLNASTKVTVAGCLPQFLGVSPQVCATTL